MGNTTAPERAGDLLPIDDEWPSIVESLPILSSPSSPDWVPETQGPSDHELAPSGVEGGHAGMHHDPDGQKQQTENTIVNSPRLWKDLVSNKEVKRFTLPDGYLDGKITVAFPEGDCSDPVVTIDPEVMDALAVAWKSSLIIKTLGTIIPYEVMKKKIIDSWGMKGNFRLLDLPKGYYVINFDDQADYMKVLIGGPWTMFGHYLVIKPWFPSFNPLTDNVATTPAWVRISNLPCILYEENVLLQIAKGRV